MHQSTLKKKEPYINWINRPYKKKKNQPIVWWYMCKLCIFNYGQTRIELTDK